MLQQNIWASIIFEPPIKSLLLFFIIIINGSKKDNVLYNHTIKLLAMYKVYSIKNLKFF